MSNKTIDQVLSTDDLEHQINRPSYTLVYYYATWCKPCILFIPELHKISDQFTSIKFILAEVDELDILESYNISKLPTIRLYKSGELITELDKNKLVNQLTNYTNINLLDDF